MEKYNQMQNLNLFIIKNKAFLFLAVSFICFYVHIIPVFNGIGTIFLIFSQISFWRGGENLSMTKKIFYWFLFALLLGFISEYGR